jgi:hypothetical protein
VNQHIPQNPQRQDISELAKAILEEWRRFPQEKLRRLNYWLLQLEKVI